MPRLSRNAGRRLRIAAAAASLALIPFGAAWTLGRWLDYSETPEPSDLMVVLAGGVSRPFYAAELFSQGLAPEVWLSRPARTEAQNMAVALGAVPREEEINRTILVKKGVPPARIHFFGDGVVSTVDEARALGREADLRGKKVLVITSRFHARRSGIIFRRALPGVRIVIAASPYEKFTRRWWKERELAPDAVLEAAKILFYLAGGRFTARPAPR